MVTLTELQCKVMEFILHTMSETGMPPTLREIASHFGWKAVGSAQDVVLALRKKGALMPPVAGKSRQLVPVLEVLEQLEAQGLWNPYKGRGSIPGANSGGAARTAVVAGSNASDSASMGRGERGINAQRPSLPNLSGRIPGANGVATGRGRITLDELAQAVENFVFAPLVGLVQAGNPAESVDSHAGEFVPFPSVGRRGDESRFFAVTVEGYSMMNVGFMPGDVLLVESAAAARNGDIVLAAVGNHEVTVKRFALRGSHLYRSAFELLPKEEHAVARVPPALLVPENPDFEPIPFGLAESDHIVGLVRSLYRKDIL